MIKFLEIIPQRKAIVAAITFGSLISTNPPVWSKKKQLEKLL